MGIKTGINWTDATWNPWIGCTKVSPACANCYMFRDMDRYGRDPTIVVRTKPSTFHLPTKKDRQGEYVIPAGSKVFACSWSDWFHADADPWRDEAWEIVRQRQDVIFQIVTKRVERIESCLPRDWGNGWPNVWLIATVDDQERLEERVPILADIPAAIRGLSIEPLLGPLDFRLRRAGALSILNTHIHWVIAGGESGPHARPFNPDWLAEILLDCLSHGVPFWFKQWGEWLPIGKGYPGASPGNSVRFDGQKRIVHQGPGDYFYLKVGTKQAGRMYLGCKWSQLPRVGK